MTSAATVLIVEDEPAVAESFELMLKDEYDVRTAHDGATALERLDEDIDVVLLDRMMPELSGDEVLAEIHERDIDPRVAMVTAVDPDFDIIGMGFDDYVTKPPTEAELKQTVEDLLSRTEYNRTVQEYQSLLAKRAALQSEKADEALAESEEYAALERRIETLDAEFAEVNDRLLDDTEFVGALRDLAGETSEEVDR